jgi:hypothetical protein
MAGFGHSRESSATNGDTTVYKLHEQIGCNGEVIVLCVDYGVPLKLDAHFAFVIRYSQCESTLYTRETF